MGIAERASRCKQRARYWLAIWLILGGILEVNAAPLKTAPWPSKDFQRGVVYSSWDGSYPESASHTAHLAHFKSLGVTWIEVMTFAHQPQVDRPEIKLINKWPATFLAKAQQQGFKILLKPHVFSMQFYDGSNRWRGSIQMKTAADWTRWFANYERFIVDQARKAANANIEMFSVGLEYVEATRGHDAEWRKIIRAVRAVYSGHLTYSADGNHELANIKFWDALDVIGVNAYFKMTDRAQPDVSTLVLGLTPHLVRIESLAHAYQRPVILTEVGLPSVAGAAQSPWAWPSGKEIVDVDVQAKAYEALIHTCSRSAWCHGTFWWKYYERAEGNSHRHDYSPKGKPAEKVLSHWYITQDHP